MTTSKRTYDYSQKSFRLLLSINPYPLNPASVLLGFSVVIDANEQDVACIFSNLRWILLTLDLVDGSVGGVVELQLDDQCRLADIATWNHHEVGISLACGIFTVDDILVLCPDICHGEHAGKRILVVV